MTRRSRVCLVNRRDFIHHSPSHRYAVQITYPTHTITAGMSDFVVDTEQHDFHVDPGNTVLTTTRFATVVMPNTWVRSYEQGRVFYNSFAHTLGVIERREVLDLLLRGMHWAAAWGGGGAKGDNDCRG